MFFYLIPVWLREKTPCNIEPRSTRKKVKSNCWHSIFRLWYVVLPAQRRTVPVDHGVHWASTTPCTVRAQIAGTIVISCRNPCQYAYEPEAFDLAAANSARWRETDIPRGGLPTAIEFDREFFRRAYFTRRKRSSPVRQNIRARTKINRPFRVFATQTKSGDCAFGSVDSNCSSSRQRREPTLSAVHMPPTSPFKVRSRKTRFVNHVYVPRQPVEFRTLKISKRSISIQSFPFGKRPGSVRPEAFKRWIRTCVVPVRSA